MRAIDIHHGSDLNQSLQITADEKGPERATASVGDALRTPAAWTGIGGGPPRDPIAS